MPLAKQLQVSHDSYQPIIFMRFVAVLDVLVDFLHSLVNTCCRWRMWSGHNKFMKKMMNLIKEMLSVIMSLEVLQELVLKIFMTFVQKSIAEVDLMKKDLQGNIFSTQDFGYYVQYPVTGEYFLHFRFFLLHHCYNHLEYKAY